MALPDKLLMDIWTAVLGDKSPPFNRALGIVKFWCDSPYDFGSPLGPERMDGNDAVQMFTRAAIRWRPGIGAERVER